MRNTYIRIMGLALIATGLYGAYAFTWEKEISCSRKDAKSISICEVSTKYFFHSNNEVKKDYKIKKLIIDRSFSEDNSESCQILMDLQSDSTEELTPYGSSAFCWLDAEVKAANEYFFGNTNDTKYIFSTGINWLLFIIWFLLTVVGFIALKYKRK